MANTVIRWVPARNLNTMDRIFDELRRNGTGLNSLPLDLLETADAYTVRANVPGLNAEDIQINLKDDVLSIVVELPAFEAAEGTRVLRQERIAGKLARRIQLRNTVDADAIEATYDAGVLTLTLPKAEAAKPRQIPVRAGAVLEAAN